MGMVALEMGCSFSQNTQSSVSHSEVYAAARTTPTFWTCSEETTFYLQASGGKMLKSTNVIDESGLNGREPGPGGRFITVNAGVSNRPTEDWKALDPSFFFGEAGGAEDSEG